jgi:tRNA A-37 threonylcarbamoyl transferase component Bud32
MAVRRFLVAGRYRLHEPVGSGGMGRVWMARDEMLDRDVAVKEFVPPEWMTDAEKSRLRDRTLREARSAARLNHPHVVRIYDVVHADDQPWIVMEYVPSRSLHQVIKEDGPYSPVETARIGLDVLDALTAAHRAGVLHRDVKPHNVLIGHDGRVVLTDFGLATFVDDGSVTGPGLVVGSPQYVSPERARDGASTVESDLWSLGATLYAAVEGRSPYARENAMATLMALATEPADEPERAGPLADVLRGLLQHEPADRLEAGEVEQQLRAIVAAGGAALPASRAGAARRVIAGRAAVVPGPRRPIDDNPLQDEAAAPATNGVAVSTAPAIPEAAAQPQPQPKNQIAQLAPPPQRRPPVEDEPISAPPVPRRSRVWPVVAGALVVALLAGVGLIAAWVLHRDKEDVHESAPPAVFPTLQESSPAPTGFSPVSCEQPTSANAQHTPQPNAKHRANGWSLPPGWSYYTDSSGFQVAVPDRWTYEKVGTTICFRDPRNIRYLSVDPGRNPEGDPVQACKTEAARLVKAGELPKYNQIGIVRAPMQIKAADWEYTYDGPEGDRMHATTRWFASAGKAFALGWATREFDWQINMTYHSVVVSSFSATTTAG